MALTIKYLEKNSVDKVLHFFNTEKGDILRFNNRKKQEFDWLFLDGYYKSALYSIATDSETDEIVGTYAGILIPMISPAGEKVVTMKGEDTLISFDRMIKYGKRDILVDMYRFLEEGAATENVSFLWGFSPVPKAFRRCGCTTSGEVKSSFLVIRPFRFYSQRLGEVAPVTVKRKIVIISFALSNWLFQSFSHMGGPRFTFHNIKLDDLNFSKIREFLPSNAFSIWLDREYLEWRIGRNPSGLKYGFLEFIDDHGEIISYLIYSENADRTFFIEQPLFDKKLKSVERIGVINSAKRFFSLQGAVMIRALGFSHNRINAEEMNLLKRTGFHFFTSREPSYFLFNNVTDPGVRIEDIYVSRLNTQGVV
jgi:hypothetical protein